MDDASDAGTADEQADDDDSFVINAMARACIVCGQLHNAHCCPALNGNADAQRQVFQNLRTRRSPPANVNVVATSSSDDADADLLGLDSDEDLVCCKPR